MEKMQISLSCTYAGLDRKIGYNKFADFENTIYKLQDICDKAKIVKIETTGIEETLWFFQNLTIRHSNNESFEYSVFIPDKKEFIGQIVSNTYHKKSNSIYDSWLMMIRNLSESIDALHCFYEEGNEIIVFLQNIVLFLSSVSIYNQKADWEKIVG